MTESPGTIEIPNRALFKASEVCELMKVQPYVLRSWEAEFPDLGVSKSAGAPRVYRRTDVEQVARIKHLLLVEGLTLAGARRKIEEDTTPIGVDAPAIDELIGQNARERLTEVKRGLRSILDLLGGRSTATEFRLAPPPVHGPRRAALNGKAALRGKNGSSRSASSRPSTSPKRKRSA